MTARYAWIVDRDPSAEGGDELDKECDRKGTVGPRNAPAALVERLKAGEGERWRTVYEPGEDPEHDDIVHEGRILVLDDDYDVPADEEAAFGPLWDLSQPDCGAVDIQYRQGNRWVTL